MFAGTVWDPACFICLFSYLIPALNSPRAAQGQQQAGPGSPLLPGQRRGERLQICAAGCFPPMGALHPIAVSTLQQDPGPQGVSPGQVWDTLGLHVPGQSPEVGDPSSRQPGDRAGNGRKTVRRSYPPLQLQGLGFGGYPDFGAMGNLGSSKLG